MHLPHKNINTPFTIESILISTDPMNKNSGNDSGHVTESDKTSSKSSSPIPKKVKIQNEKNSTKKTILQSEINKNFFILNLINKSNKTEKTKRKTITSINAHNFIGRSLNWKISPLNFTPSKFSNKTYKNEINQTIQYKLPYPIPIKNYNSTLKIESDSTIALLPYSTNFFGTPINFSAHSSFKHHQNISENKHKNFSIYYKRAIEIVRGLYTANEQDLLTNGPLDMNNIQNDIVNALIEIHGENSIVSVNGGYGFKNPIFDQLNAYRRNNIIIEKDYYFCKICTKKFKMVKLLYRHLNSHSAIKKFICSICFKGFNDTFDLKRHTRIHTGIRPFQCNEIDCNKQFSQRCSLEAHQIKIHGIKSAYMHKQRRNKMFICEICGETTYHHKDSQKHKQSHKK
ncbi:hypothetical protein A3Q56_01077 [Intoshia linei]|uniref:C2H2-type domain-containing protein n=1 Tax=Intoshia linei TaxID=1819745 RepID=A0A177BA49_9BILA|nr:hypothetical protein A3Q56_01077 [Intoshia linei]